MSEKKNVSDLPSLMVRLWRADTNRVHVLRYERRRGGNFFRDTADGAGCNYYDDDHYYIMLII